MKPLKNCLTTRLQGRSLTYRGKTPSIIPGCQVETEVEFQIVIIVTIVILIHGDIPRRYRNLRKSLRHLRRPNPARAEQEAEFIDFNIFQVCNGAAG